MIKKFKFVADNGYSIENPRVYIGNHFDPIEDKINELISTINKQQKQIDILIKYVDILTKRR